MEEDSVGGEHESTMGKYNMTSIDYISPTISQNIIIPKQYRKNKSSRIINFKLVRRNIDDLMRQMMDRKNWGLSENFHTGTRYKNFKLKLCQNLTQIPQIIETWSVTYGKFATCDILSNKSIIIIILSELKRTTSLVLASGDNSKWTWGSVLMRSTFPVLTSVMDQLENIHLLTYVAFS